MKALILNSGIGSRMGVLTSEHPKCMTEISCKETILSRQLNQLIYAGIDDVIITTGAFNDVLEEYVRALDLPIKITYVKNSLYMQTNSIYSIYCAREYLTDTDIIMMHGDVVFENKVFDKLLEFEQSCMVVSSTTPLPDKDFKVIVNEGSIMAIGTELFENAITAQPLFKLDKKIWSLWLDEIVKSCENGVTNCYAETVFKNIADKCELRALNIENLLCAEIDNSEDLSIVKSRLEDVENRTVYMCFSTDILHSGHFSIIRKAQRYGKLIIGVLSDEAVLNYKQAPLLPFTERRAMFENISGVNKVVEQKTLSYKDNIRKYKPNYVVHGDDWKIGFQKPIREEVIFELSMYGGILIEFPYRKDKIIDNIEKRRQLELSLPDFRRSQLKKAIEVKGLITAIEAHSGLTGLIAEKTVIYENNEPHQFDAMWISSLCDSTAKGKPDIELVDMTSRFRTVDDIMEVTTKPIIFDGDTGGLPEHFIYTVRTLERMGVSMIIIEDKTGLKKNSLFGTNVEQTQDSIENFCLKIQAGKHAQKTQDFMICARIESLILEKGIKDAIDRAFAYVKAGADAIMIHSRKKDPDEVFEFIANFRKKDNITPLVVVPTSYNTVTEEEFRDRGVNVVIYANQLTRSGFPAMKNAAELILKNHRAKECDNICMPIDEIITLIPNEQD